MKNKKIVILVCTLLLSLSVISVQGTMKLNNKIVDRSQIMAGWIEKQQLLASDGDLIDQLGYCVDIDGDYAIVSSFGDNSYAGSAYIFKYDGSSWAEQQKLTASGADRFNRVSICGDYAVVGAWGDSLFSGAAYVFKRSGSAWTEQQKLTASDPAANDYFGISTDIYGDYIVVGAYYKNSQQGAAYVFKRDGSVWSQQQKLIASGGTAGDHFGICVSINGEYILVGAEGDGNDEGAAYVFIRSGSAWSQQQKLEALDGADGDRFGMNVCIDEDYALIGAFIDDSEKGSAYVFKRSGTNWAQEAKITAADGVAGDRFGNSVSIDGEYAVIGTYYDDNKKGSTYVFKRSGTSWAQDQKLTASTPVVEDWFGIDVSIDGFNILIGAYGDDDKAMNAGCAYIFGKDNNAPNPPVISGPPKGKAGNIYTYTFTSTDPDGDDVSYYIKWGDGATSGWTTLQPSGSPGYSESYSWASQGTYVIEAKAKDSNGAESNWATYSITMPRNRVLNNFLIEILNQFPLLQQILNI